MLELRDLCQAAETVTAENPQYFLLRANKYPDVPLFHFSNQNRSINHNASYILATESFIPFALFSFRTSSLGNMLVQLTL